MVADQTAGVQDLAMRRFYNMELDARATKPLTPQRRQRADRFAAEVLDGRAVSLLEVGAGGGRDARLLERVC